MSEPVKPGILDRLRARFGWLDHLLRAARRFSEHNGSFFAAGLTYYTIFAIFPLLMVEDRIRSSVSSELGRQLVDVIQSAIEARASVGVIGLATAAWAGLGWMWHLREALSEMWANPVESAGYLRTKLSDLVAMLGMFLVVVATIALTALGHAAPMAAILNWLEIPDFPLFDWTFRGISTLISLLVSWLLFTWMVGRLPRKPVSVATAMRAGLLAAVGFELFKQLGSIYLKIVLRSPAGAAFGPVLGLMVFGFVTASLILFATAWAATASDVLAHERVEPPRSAVTAPRIQAGQSGNDQRSLSQLLAAMAVGAIAALTFSRLSRWLR